MSKNLQGLVFTWKICFGSVSRQSDWNKLAQSCSRPEVKRWLWCMTWQFPPIPQIYCFKSTAPSHDSIIQSILLGWLSPAKYLTIWEPCVTHLFWFGENNCASSLMSVACRLHISLRLPVCKCLIGVVHSAWEGMEAGINRLTRIMPCFH